MGRSNGSEADSFEDQLRGLGFRLEGTSRRGGRMWVLPFNAYLTFTLHDYDDRVMLTWAYALGEFCADRGWILGTGETSMHELYPQTDVRLPLDVDAIGGEITRVLSRFRLDLGDPAL